MYDKLAGMTGTADTEARSRQDLQPRGRGHPAQPADGAAKDQADLVYRTERENFNAIVEEIKVLNEKGQPALVVRFHREVEALSSALKA